MSGQEKKTVLVTAVGGPPGLNTLRFLHESQKYDIVAADADKYSAELYRYASRGVKYEELCRASNKEKYIKKLCQVIKKHNVSAIIPCIEEEAKVLSENREVLKKYNVKMLLPDAEVFNIATNKAESTLIAEKCGISCPLSTVIHNGTCKSEIRNIINGFYQSCRLPWIIKPSFGSGMRDVNKVETKEDAFAALETYQQEVIVQECIPGKVGDMYLVGLLYDDKGIVRRRFSSRSFKTLYPEGGPATAGISVYLPELIVQTEVLLAAIGGWKGVAGTEWMWDPRDGKYKFIEVNPRLWGYSSLAAGAGAHFHVCLAELALGNDICTDPGFREGVVMIRSSHDVIFETCPFYFDR